MYRTPINFHKRMMRGDVPIAYIVVHTPMGYRAYGEKELSAVFGMIRLLADGSVMAGGDETAGSEGDAVASKSARILNIGTFERTLQPVVSDLLAAYQSKQRQHIAVVLDDTDGYFTRMLPKEPLLGREMRLYVGFEGTPQSEHLNILCGSISEICRDQSGQLTLEADEK